MRYLKKGLWHMKKTYVDYNKQFNFNMALFSLLVMYLTYGVEKLPRNPQLQILPMLKKSICL